MRKLYLLVVLTSFVVKSQVQQLDEVILNAQRLPSNVSPMSTSIVSDTLGLLLQQEIGTSLTAVPGLFVSSQQNYTQDTRISIRGFGTRAAFGIRGIKVLLDGIPITTADGQTQLDHVPLSQISNVQVLRGLSGGLYGNASGGVLFLKSSPITNQKNITATLGDFNTQSIVAHLSKAKEKNQFRITLEHKKQAGYRSWSAYENSALSLTKKFLLKNHNSLELNYFYFNSPFAQDPGGITREQTEQNRKQARSANVLYQAGEKVQHHMFSARWKHKSWSSYVFYTHRQLDAMLPFENSGQIDLSRDYAGAGMYHNGRKKNWLWQYGWDMAAQFDSRKRYKNLEGITGAQTLNQDERFQTIGGYGVLETQLNHWRIRGTLRSDWYRISIDDFYGDSSGNNTIAVVSPSLAIHRQLTAYWDGYLQYSTGYETPALNELSANPSGETGFNPSLKPQQSSSIELGLRHNIATFNSQLTLFYTETKNEIIPYETAQFPGQTFYANTGRVNRKGIEFESNWSFSSTGNIAVSFHYGDYKTVAKKDLPNVPRKQFSSSLKQHIGRTVLNAQLRYVGSRYANSDNTVEVPRFWTSDMYVQRSWGMTTWTLGITNIANTSYFDNIRINAFGRRYFEPAATRLLFLKCLVSF